MRPIIVEGPDGSGKSTLARRLAKDLNLPLHHPGGPPINRDEFQSRLNFYAANKEAFLFDRAPHISELVYPKAVGRLSIVSTSNLYQQLEALKPVVIFCRLKSLKEMWDSIDRSNKPHKSPEHMAEVLTQYKNIVEGYDKFMAAPGKPVKVIKYNWTEDSYDNLVKEIKKCAA